VAAAAVVVAALGAATLSGCTTQPLPAGPSDADVARYYSDLSDALWDGTGLGPGVERPVIAEVQPITRDVWARRVADCMNNAGFANYAAQGGGLTSAGAQELQPVEEKLALFSCQELYPVAVSVNEVASDEQLEYVYGYYVRFLVPCLESRGYSINPVPTRASFLAQRNVGLWNPYWVDISQNSSSLAALQRACPPMPPGIADPHG